MTDENRKAAVTGYAKTMYDAYRIRVNGQPWDTLDEYVRNAMAFMTDGARRQGWDDADRMAQMPKLGAET